VKVTTIHGEMDDSALERRDGVVDNDNEHTQWVEYWFAGELVHRSAHVSLKQHPTMQITPGDFFG